MEVILLSKTHINFLNTTASKYKKIFNGKWFGRVKKTEG
jgi:hypothetical protein